MRFAFMILVLLYLATGAAFAADYVRLGVDSIPKGYLGVEIPFYLERTCPDPTMIMGTSNGFVMTASGDATWEFEHYYPDYEVQGWFSLGFLPTLSFDDVSPDSFLLGGASMPPGGLPIVEDHLMFRLVLHIGDGEGAICVDSAWVFAAGAWKWSSMQCGLGGAPDRPLFVDKYGSDDNHPICITVYDAGPAPTWDDWVRIDVDSIPVGTVDAELPFYISRTCPYPDKVMGQSSGFVLTSTGDASWSYSGYQKGDILVTWFGHTSGIFTNAIELGSPDSFLVGSATMPPYGMPVTTEELAFTLYLDIGPGVGQLCIDSSFVFAAGAWKFSGLECGLGGNPDRPLFVAKDSSNASHPICITIYESLCGDLDIDGAVDIDDIVFLMEYVFGGGPDPNPFDKADVDCSGQIDVDDIVYLLSYVFGGGPEPCAGCP